MRGKCGAAPNYQTKPHRGVAVQQVEVGGRFLYADSNARWEKDDGRIDSSLSVELFLMKVPSDQTSPEAFSAVAAW